jgi:hypothetical protein
MKHKNFFKAVFTLIMCGSISLASAADIYLSNSGNDSNDGLSSGAPVKTLSMAFTKALAGDVIHVMNMININEEPAKSGARADINITGTSVYTPAGTTLVYNTWNVGSVVGGVTYGTLGIIPLTRSVTLIGDDKATCGFDGNNSSCIIRHDHGSGTGTVITYKNLTFKNGKSNDASGGGALYFRGASASAAVIENCDFTTNVGNQGNVGTATVTLKAGGALSIVHGTATIKKCSFTANNASKGAALYIQAGNVVMDSCVFADNDLSLNLASTGGAIYSYPTSTTSGPLNLEVKNSLFKNNKAENQGGAVFIGETVAQGTNLKFTNCAFVDNSTINATVTGTAGMGGAVFVNNVIVGAVSNTAFVNCTFKGNQAGATTGGVFAVNSILVNSKLDLINCTLSGNKVSGATGAGGAAIRYLKAASAGVRKIQNCIIENNTAVDANMTSAADYADLGMEVIVDPVTFVETPSYVAGTSLIIEKSLIGSCKNVDFETQFPLNKVNYVFDLNGSIVNSYKAKLGVFNEDKNYFPLLAASEAIAYGNTSYLRDLTPSVMSDQIGRIRPWTTCSAGAYEFNDATGLKNTINNSILVYRNANNQITVKNADATSGIITVCNMMGQVMYSTAMNTAITTINKSLTAGVYMVMVNSNGKASSQKVILN